MDFKKIINVALIPAVAMIVLGVIGAVLGFALSSVPFVPLLVGLGFFAIDCLIMLYAGYSATKQKLDLISAALVGAIAAFVASIINGIIGIVLMLVGVSTVAGSATGAAIGGAGMLIIGIIGLVLGAVINLVIGAVLGAIGGFIGQKM
jgi:uncharacterized membrane protein